MRRLALALLLLLVAILAAPRLMQPDTEAWQASLVAAWSEAEAPDEVTHMRRMNPEWDFMSRTFLTLALTEQALAEPELVDAHVAVIDAMIADTLAQEAAHGQAWFLMDYAHSAPWEGDGRSLFVDGEVLVMLGARRVLRDDRWAPEMQARADRVAESFGAASALPLAESYPDEGWTFCHAMAMLGLRMHEVLDGADHSAVKQAWLAALGAQLIDPESGLIVSEFDMAGRHHDGPEGSSLWWTVTALQLLDPELAQQQYTLAREALGGQWMGWGYAREWPRGAEGPVDVDSGPIVPFLQASPSSSGFAILAANAFDDQAWYGELTGALGAAQAVMLVHPILAAMADNAVGQAVILWGLRFGPLWARLSASTDTSP